MISKIFEWCATGQYSLDGLARKAYGEGFSYKNTGKPVPKRTMRDILRNPFYTGVMGRQNLSGSSRANRFNRIVEAYAGCFGRTQHKKLATRTIRIPILAAFDLRQLWMCYCRRNEERQIYILPHVQTTKEDAAREANSYLWARISSSNNSWRCSVSCALMTRSLN